MTLLSETVKEIDLEALRGHTAGPWEVGVKGNGAPGYVYCDNALGSAVAIVYGAPLLHSVFSRAEEEANARLIAAAPDLLAELTTRRARDAEVEALVKAVIEYRFALQEYVKQRTTQARAIDAELALNAALAPFTGAIHDHAGEMT